MVYREVLAPDSATESFKTPPSTVDHNFPFATLIDLAFFERLQDEFANNGVTADDLSATADIEKHPDHLLLVDKAVSGEAMEILYKERYFNLRVGRTLVCQGTAIRDLADLISVGFVTRWPNIRKICNIKITFDEISILESASNFDYYLSVEIPCFCSALKTRGKQGPLQGHASYRVSPDSLGYLLEPMGKLRAKKITLHSCCSARDAVQQSFDQTTSNVTKKHARHASGKSIFQSSSDHQTRSPESWYRMVVPARLHISRSQSGRRGCFHVPRLYPKRANDAHKAQQVQRRPGHVRRRGRPDED
ncbi:MAG: hypothetical protein Q9228_007416 [Teloschistes exilis]